MFYVRIAAATVSMFVLIVAGIAVTDAAWHHGWLPGSYRQAQNLASGVFAITIVAAIVVWGIVRTWPRPRLAAVTLVVVSGGLCAGVAVLGSLSGWLPEGRGGGFLLAIPFLLLCGGGLRLLQARSRSRIR